MIALIQTHIHPKGGLEKAANGLVKAFQAQGHTPFLLTADPFPNVKGCQVVSLPCDKKRGASFYKSFQQQVDAWLRDNPQQIIFGLDRTVNQTHYRAGNGSHKAYMEIRRKLEGPFSDYLRKWRSLNRFYLDWEKKAFEYPSLKRLFVNSHMVKEEITRLYRTPEDKISVVHNGVEWKELQESFKQSLFNSYQRPYHFLFAGNGYKRKGLSYLLKGLALLRSPFILSVVGYEKGIHSYKKLAKKLGIIESVNFYGPRPSLIPFYQQADCLVIPSIYDPFANTTVEALAMGLFVISSPFNGGKEVLSKENGFVLSGLEDRFEMQSALEKAISKPKSFENGLAIRESVRSLEFSNQLSIIAETSLSVQ
jgi:UDP-glucose:(heptosyl)LPS alpha-1,3-glucosyltransferase